MNILNSLAKIVGLSHQSGVSFAIEILYACHCQRLYPGAHMSEKRLHGADTAGGDAQQMRKWERRAAACYQNYFFRFIIQVGKPEGVLFKHRETSVEKCLGAGSDVAEIGRRAEDQYIGLPDLAGHGMKIIFYGASPCPLAGKTTHARLDGQIRKVDLLGLGAPVAQAPEHRARQVVRDLPFSWSCYNSERFHLQC